MTVQFKVLRSLPSQLRLHHHQPDRIQEVRHRRVVSLQAGLAEMMLVNRLRAHTRSDLALDTLRRGAEIIALTARHWFADTARVSAIHLNASASDLER